jgi:hypothetical protein
LYEAIIVDQETDFKVKFEKLEQAMVDAPTWHGAMGALNGFTWNLPLLKQAYADVPPFSAAIADKVHGGAPWPAILRNNCRRFGPTQTSIPGSVCFQVPVKKNRYVRRNFCSDAGADGDPV